MLQNMYQIIYIYHTIFITYYIINIEKLMNSKKLYMHVNVIYILMKKSVKLTQYKFDNCQINCIF